MNTYRDSIYGKGVLPNITKDLPIRHKELLKAFHFLLADTSESVQVSLLRLKQKFEIY